MKRDRRSPLLNLYIIETTLESRVYAAIVSRSHGEHIVQKLRTFREPSLNIMARFILRFGNPDGHGVSFCGRHAVGDGRSRSRVI
jgi:hypothetical protein